MSGLLQLLGIVAIVCHGKSEEVEEVTANPVPPSSEVTGSPERSRALVVTLGGSEEELIASSITSLLLTRGYDVTAFVYGARLAVWPRGSEIVKIPLVEGDPLYSMEGNQHYITPSHTDGKLYEVTSGRAAAVNQASTYDPLVTSSRRLACHSLLTNTSWTKNQTSRAKIFVTPLHFHDLCTLTFARQFDLPVVGLVTSRIGSWWSWYWLDLVPPLATNAVPPNELSANFGFFERMFNIIDFWSYISVREGDWVAPLMPSLPPSSVQPIAELYAALTTVLVAWDELTDLQLPRASFLTSVAGLQWDRDEEITKDTLLPLQRNRNGAIFCNLKLRELWVGRAAQRALLHALAATPFTVVWRGVEEAWGEGVDDGNKTENTRKGSAMFVYKEDPPMAALLAHPRHRLLISMCGESDVTAAVLVGSPTLCIPVTPDQHLTSNKLRDLGLAVVVPARDVTTNQMRDVIRELTTNRSYRSRGRQLAEEYIDQPLHVSDRVLHTLEKLMRRPWSSKRRQSHQLSLLVQSNGDVIATMLLMVTSSISVAIYAVIAFARVYIKGRRKQEEEEEEKKKCK